MKSDALQIGVKLPVGRGRIRGKYQYSVASGISNKYGRVDQRIISMLIARIRRGHFGVACLKADLHVLGRRPRCDFVITTA